MARTLKDNTLIGGTPTPLIPVNEEVAEAIFATNLERLTDRLMEANNKYEQGDLSVRTTLIDIGVLLGEASEAATIAGNFATGTAGR